MIIKPAKRLNDVAEYYFSQKLQEIRQMNARGLNIINLGIGNPDMSPSEKTIEALTASTKNRKHHGYQPYKGIPELRKAIAEWYKKIYNVQLDSENEILPLLGSKEGIMHISMAFLNEGDSVLVPNPGYPTYSSVSKLAGAKIIYYNLIEKNGWIPDLKELKSQISNLAYRQAGLKSQTKLLWLNYPNMPTGASADDKIFEELIAFAKEHKILLCHDNPYSMILHDGKFKSILAYEGAKEVAVELNSLSKSHNMAGWRIGWIAGKKEYIDTILKVKSNMDSGMFLPLQHAAIEALKNTEEWHEQQNSEYKKRREKVWKLLDALNCTYSEKQVGMFVWAKIPPAEKNAETFSENILQKSNVFITPGFIFGNNGDRYVRISLCSSVKILEEAMERIVLCVGKNLIWYR